MAAKTEAAVVMEQMGQNQQTTRPVHHVAAPGTKSSVSDCVLFVICCHPQFEDC